MTYEEAKAQRDALEADWKAKAAKLDAYPKDARGLTLETAKSARWRRDRAACAEAFELLRSFNAEFVQTYRREIRAERRRRSK